MYNHAPPGYICPFCLLTTGIENAHVLSLQADIVHKNDMATAFISIYQKISNPGHVIIVPNAHFENLFELPAAYAAAIHDLSQKVAFAMKTAYQCEGISTRQHNEPAGNQDVWHYHLHIFPRYTGDDLYHSNSRIMPAEERATCAQQLRNALATDHTRESEMTANPTA